MAEHMGYPANDLCTSCLDEEVSIHHLLTRLFCLTGGWRNFYNLKCLNDVDEPPEIKQKYELDLLK